MKKINAVLLSEKGKKEEVLLKIKDESFTITSSSGLSKILYSNIKSYKYDENKEILTINKLSGLPVKLNIVEDRELLELLDIIVDKNKKNAVKKDINKPSQDIKENAVKKDINKPSQDIKENAALETNNVNPTYNVNNNGSNGEAIIVKIVGCVGLFIFAYYIITCFTSNSTVGMPTGCYYALNRDGSTSDFKICIDSDLVTYKDVTGNTEELYPDWSSTSNYLVIKDEYDDFWFTCTFNKEDNDYMKCTGQGRGGFASGFRTTWKKK